MKNFKLGDFVLHEGEERQILAKLISYSTGDVKYVLYDPFGKQISSLLKGDYQYYGLNNYFSSRGIVISDQELFSAKIIKNPEPFFKTGEWVLFDDILVKVLDIKGNEIVLLRDSASYSSFSVFDSPSTDDLAKYPELKNRSVCKILFSPHRFKATPIQEGELVHLHISAKDVLPKEIKDHSIFKKTSQFRVAHIRNGGVHLASAEDESLNRNTFIARDGREIKYAITIFNEQIASEIFAAIKKKVEPMLSEMEQAAFRIAARKVSKTVRHSIIQILKQLKFKKEHIAIFTQILRSDYGLAMVSYLMGHLVGNFPHLKEDKRIQKLSDELRVDGVAFAIEESMEHIGKLFFNLVLAIPKVENEEADEVVVEEIEREAASSS